MDLPGKFKGGDEMKVENIVCEFQDIQVGDCFVESSLYIKTEDIRAINGITYNAVDLENGNPWHFIPESTVTSVSAKAVIE